MKELILIGAEDGLVNQRMQDYAFQLGYRWAGGISHYVEFDIDGYVYGEELMDKRVAIHCDEWGSMAYAEASYYFEYCKGEYDGIEVIDYVALEKRRVKVMETE